MIEICLEFPHSYGVEQILELPGTGKLGIPLIYFPGSKTRPEHDGLWFKIIPASGAPWAGVFAFGCGSKLAVSRVISLPDPDRLCVISRGAAYAVRSDDPSVWEEIPIFPVIDVRTVPEYGVVIFADFTGLIAFRGDSVLWKSSRLVWDDLKILSVTSETIDGTGYDPMNSGASSRFSVDFKTGKSRYPAPVSIDGRPAG